MQGAGAGGSSGWLGTGMFGNDQYNPAAGDYQQGAQMSQAAMPQRHNSQPNIALALLNQPGMF